MTIFDMKCVIKINGEIFAVIDQFSRAMIICSALADLYEDDESRKITLEFKPMKEKYKK